MIDRSVRRTADGRYELRLTAAERELLAGLGPRMREVFEDESDPVRKRLFPVAYTEDADRETEYRLLVHDELASSQLAALATLEQTADAEELDEEQALAWLRAINQVRLVLGERLSVTEEGEERPTSPTDPRASAFAVYDYLSGLQDSMIEAFALPAEGTSPEENLS
jgi:hypothetical protein